LRKWNIPKNTFHSTVTNLLKPSKGWKEKIPSRPRFICCIILWITINFGCANTVFGGIGEHNMKPNVKDPARRTRYQDDQEYSILFKQYKNIYYMLEKLN